jgi:hypothetical protein
MTATAMERNDGAMTGITQQMRTGTTVPVEVGDKPADGAQGNHENKDAKDDGNNDGIVRVTVKKEICKQVLRQKLAGKRHLVISQAIHPSYLDSLFQETLDNFDPQTVHYNGGVAAVKEWKISCYLEVMAGGIPTTHPNLKLLQLYQPLLDECNDLFLYWYRQQHAANKKNSAAKVTECRRIMTFLTRYTPNPGEQALLKVRLICVAYVSASGDVAVTGDCCPWCLLFTFVVCVLTLLFCVFLYNDNNNNSTWMALAR